MTYTKRNALWYGGFWLLLTLWLRFALPESIIGWERHQLFRFSTEYPTFFSIHPYPILSYVQAFFTQFYLYPLLGAAIIGGLLALGMGAWQRLTGRYWTGAVWAALMLPLIPYINLLWILAWLVLLGGGLLISLRGLSTGGRLGLTAACGLLGSLLIQENIAFAVVFWTIVLLASSRSKRTTLYGFLAVLLGSALGLLTVRLCYPFFRTNDLMNWPLLNILRFLVSFPGCFILCPLSIRILNYIGLPILICLPLAAWLPARTGTLWKSISALVIAGLLASAAYLNLRYQAEDFYLVDRLAGENRWIEAMEAAEQAFFERVRPESVGSNRSFFLQVERRLTHTTTSRLGIRPAYFQDDMEEDYMADMLKICLLSTRQASNRLFAYNGSYLFPLLFPKDLLHLPASYAMMLYYMQNGLYAEALHLLYDFVTTHRISTAVLEPLLWNSVVVGDYEPCRKFIRLFEQSLFHKDIARRYTAYLADTAQTARRPEILAAREKLPADNHIVLGYSPDDNNIFRLLHNADNDAVFEYAIALWLVYKNHERILEELPKIRQNYQVLPIHVQEAVLMNFPPEQIDEAPEDIHPGIKARYMAFLHAYELYANGYTPFQKIQRGFEDTYWYHLFFNDFKNINAQPDEQDSSI